MNIQKTSESISSCKVQASQSRSFRKKVPTARLCRLIILFLYSNPNFTIYVTRTKLSTNRENLLRRSKNRLHCDRRIHAHICTHKIMRLLVPSCHLASQSTCKRSYLYSQVG